MELKKGVYTLQGHSFEELAKLFGTPLYVYDADIISRQVNALKGAFGNCKIKYAAKALTNISILKFLKNQGVGVDVVSIQEAQIARKAGFIQRSSRKPRGP